MLVLTVSSVRLRVLCQECAGRRLFYAGFTGLGSAIIVCMWQSQHLSRNFFPARSSIQHGPGAQAVLPDGGASSPACVPHHLLFPNPGVGQSGNKASVSTSEKWAQRQQRRPHEAVKGGGSAMREAPGQHLPLPHPPSLPPSLPCSALVAPPSASA